MREERQRRRRMRHRGFGGRTVALLAVPPVLYVILAAAFGWWPAGSLNDALYLRNNGVAATGVVIESEEQECPESDTDPGYAPPVQPPPPPPPPPMGPYRNLDGANAALAPPAASDDIEAQGADGCGWSIVAVDYEGTTYERKFPEFRELGTELEVMLDPDDPGRFVSREATETWPLVGEAVVLVGTVGIFALIFYLLVAQIRNW